MKISLSKKSMVSALLAIAIGMTLNVPIAVRGAKPNVARMAPASATERPNEKKLKQAFDKLPLYFIESPRGTDGHAAYYVQGKDKSLFFTPKGITVTLETAVAASEAGEEPARDIEARRWVVKLDFLGANPQARLSGRQQTSAQISYFRGSKAEWQTGLKTYSSIIYADLWPGIDLVYSGTATQVKHEFIVRPGGDVRDIKLAWRGASSVKLNRAGQLEIDTPVGSFTDDKPSSYQEQDGRRAEVKSDYRLEPTDEEGIQVYGFDVGQYDRDQTLVIDPMMIIYCGYIGGGRDEMALDVAVDGDGYAYVTGVTTSDTSNGAWGQFPATVGPDLTFNGGLSGDAFVAKISTDGSGLVYCGYIGGSNGEYGFGIAVDNLGRAYVTGITFSDQQSLPVRRPPPIFRGGLDLTYNGDGDAFIARVNAAGTALDYCGYFGGSGNDTGRDIAVDNNYNAYIIGNTDSSNFPRMIGPNLTYGGGDSDVFVTKVNNNGATSFSGFIGGMGTDYGSRLAVDRTGNAYVTGSTTSDEQSFPVSTGPYLTLNNGIDGFVAKVNASGQQLDYCGYIGGGSGEGIAVNTHGEAYLCGIAGSDLHVVVGPSLVSGGLSDAFVAKLNSGGTAYIYCGYIGGSSPDSATGIALDSVGRAYVTGVTHSADFPVKGGPDLSFNGDEADAFITCVRPNGASLFYSSYLGGSGYEYPNGIAVAPASNVSVNGAPAIIVGRTTSGHRSAPASGYVPFPIKEGPGLIYHGTGPFGWGDAFVAKIGPGI